MAYGWIPDKPGPSCPQSALAGSEFVIRMINCGVDGFNRWSFLNRGDLDGQWQFVDTWDRKKKKLLKDFPPHPNSYFCLGLLSRFMAKHSTVLASRVEGGRIDGWQRVFAGAAQPGRKPHAGGRQRCSRGVQPETRRRRAVRPAAVLPLPLRRSGAQPGRREGRSAERVPARARRRSVARPAAARQPDDLQHLQAAARCGGSDRREITCVF